MTPAKKKGKPSIKDVAELAGVSRTAVSLVLNNGEIRISDEKRAAILEAAKKLDYKPHTGARRLARRKTDTLGLVFPYAPAALSELFLFDLTRNIATAARSRQYDILVDFYHSAKPETLAADPGRVDGTILIRDRNTPEGIEGNLEGTRHPSIIIGGGFMKRSPKNYVDIDIRTGTYEVTRHLVGLGHERIVFMAAIPSATKHDGYSLALKEAGLKAAAEIVPTGGASEPDIEEAVRSLLNRRPWPTAIVCANDMLAIQVIKALNLRGLSVPKDVSVVGFDDTETAALSTPSLTTVRIPTGELAEEAVASLVDRIEGKATASIQTILPTTLVVRDSSGPASKQLP